MSEKGFSSVPRWVSSWMGQNMQVVPASDYATLTARVAELEGVLRSLKPASHYESEDPWYSCPKANKPRHAYTGEPYCDCGADDTNAKIDACLAGADPEKQP